MWCPQPAGHNGCRRVAPNPRMNHRRTNICPSEGSREYLPTAKTVRNRRTAGEQAAFSGNVLPAGRVWGVGPLAGLVKKKNEGMEMLGWREKMVCRKCPPMLDLQHSGRGGVLNSNEAEASAAHGRGDNSRSVQCVVYACYANDESNAVQNGP